MPRTDKSRVYPHTPLSDQRGLTHNREDRSSQRHAPTSPIRDQQNQGLLTRTADRSTLTDMESGGRSSHCWQCRSSQRHATHVPIGDRQNQGLITQSETDETRAYSRAPPTGQRGLTWNRDSDRANATSPAPQSSHEPDELHVRVVVADDERRRVYLRREVLDGGTVPAMIAPSPRTPRVRSSHVRLTSRLHLGAKRGVRLFRRGVSRSRSRNLCPTYASAAAATMIRGDQVSSRPIVALSSGALGAV